MSNPPDAETLAYWADVVRRADELRDAQRRRLSRKRQRQLRAAQTRRRAEIERGKLSA